MSRSRQLFIRAQIIALAALFAAALAPLPAEAWTLSVIRNGDEPVPGLVMDPAGTLYGVTDSGGVRGSGFIYELSWNAQKAKWQDQVLYNFCEFCGTGAGSFGPLVLDGSG